MCLVPSYYSVVHFGLKKIHRLNFTQSTSQFHSVSGLDGALYRTSRFYFLSMFHDHVCELSPLMAM